MYLQSQQMTLEVNSEEFMLIKLALSGFLEKDQILEAKQLGLRLLDLERINLEHQSIQAEKMLLKVLEEGTILREEQVSHQ